MERIWFSDPTYLMNHKAKLDNLFWNDQIASDNVAMYYAYHDKMK